MKTIYRYSLVEPGCCRILMKHRAIDLSVVQQNGIPQLWALVDTDEPDEPSCYYVGVTGAELPPEHQDWDYVGTFQIQNGNSFFVGHVWNMRCSQWSR